MKCKSKFDAREIELRYIDAINELVHIQALCRRNNNIYDSDMIQQALDIIKECRRDNFEDNNLDMQFVLSK